MSLSAVQDQLKRAEAENAKLRDELQKLRVKALDRPLRPQSSAGDDVLAENKANKAALRNMLKAKLTILQREVCCTFQLTIHSLIVPPYQIPKAVSYVTVRTDMQALMEKRDVSLVQVLEKLLRFLVHST